MSGFVGFYRAENLFHLINISIVRREHSGCIQASFYSLSCIQDKAMSGFVGFYRAENFFHLINISSELKLVDVYRPLCIACPVYRTRSCRVLSGSTELKISFI